MDETVRTLPPDDVHFDGERFTVGEIGPLEPGDYRLGSDGPILRVLIPEADEEDEEDSPSWP